MLQGNMPNQFGLFFDQLGVSLLGRQKLDVFQSLERFHQQIIFGIDAHRFTPNLDRLVFLSQAPKYLA